MVGCVMDGRDGKEEAREVGKRRGGKEEKARWQRIWSALVTSRGPQSWDPGPAEGPALEYLRTPVRHGPYLPRSPEQSVVQQSLPLREMMYWHCT